MELVVLDARNLPARPVIAVRMGAAQQQAQVEVNQPLLVPHPGQQHPKVAVSLFQQLASQVLPRAGPSATGGPEPSEEVVDAICSIPIRKIDGAASQVKLRVRRGGDAASPRTASSGPAGNSLEDEERARALELIHGLAQDVFKEQPEDPVRYMLEQLRKTRKGVSGGSPGYVPKPPAGPCPEKNGRSLANHQRNGTSKPVGAQA
jgi:hypothetical protein